MNARSAAAWLLALLSALPPALPALEEAPSAAGEGIVEVVDLRQEAARMEAERLPLMLLVSLHHCPYCVRIKEEILGPMVKSGEYVDRVLIRELFIDAGSRVRDFAGREREGAAVADDYGVDLAPTLLFLDARGRELSKRLVGLYTVEMFPFYVEAALEEASRKMR